MKSLLTLAGIVAVSLFYSGLEVATIHHMDLAGILVLSAFIFLAWAISVGLLYFVAEGK